MKKQMLKQCGYTTQKENIGKYTNINPTNPNLQAAIKLHKPNTQSPSPINNCKYMPAYDGSCLT
jgi:hypothetical protein